MPMKHDENRITLIRLKTLISTVDQKVTAYVDDPDQFDESADEIATWKHFHELSSVTAEASLLASRLFNDFERRPSPALYMAFGAIISALVVSVIC